MAENDDIVATNEAAKNIKAIDKDSVHRICSGQVVLTLAVAVKELLENALDAGSTTVEIRLKEHGRDLIEVIDNGSGVEECNFQGLTLKHHTSKIQEFTDLLAVETFGFRGEALSSLCALSKLTVITKHKSTEYAHKITYDKHGLIVEKKKCARQTGTTVILENLFSTLPVRHKEFHRNLKREFTKMCNLLYAYCLISTGVKIICTNTNSKGQKTTIASTQSTNTIKDNISCIFGHSQLSTLLDFKQISPTIEISEEYKIDPNIEIPFEIDGVISNCKASNGRSAQDRQFLYVNSRACEIPKITKLINTTYHQFNATQYPFIFLNIIVKRSMVDVNVTPDKRKLFLENEQILLAVIKSSLLKMYQKNIQNFDAQNLLPGTQRGIKRNNDDSSIKPFVMRTLLEKRIKISDDKVGNLSEVSSDEEKDKSMEFVACSIKIETPKAKVIEFNRIKDINEVEFQACDSHLDTVEKENLRNVIEEVKPKTIPSEESIEAEQIEIKETQLSSTHVPGSDDNIPQESEVVEIQSSPPRRISLNKASTDSRTQATEYHSALETQSASSADKPKYTIEMYQSDGQSSPQDVTEMPDNDDVEFDLTQIPTRGEKVINVTIEQIRAKLLAKKEKLEETQLNNLKFHAEIKPSANSNAEKELEREISKDKFSQMEIIGQFNLGFIICKLAQDLFIVDQHATDEKYNFEILQKTTVLKRQKLVVPQKLQLTTANKAVIIEHMEIFNKNGFLFDIKENGEDQDILLTEIPLSKNIYFGKDDIDDLLFMLHDNSLNDNGLTVCRPTRIRTMLASRACRKSVMIGSALSKQDMQRLITHMGEIEHPWNCPHGRPTMRHLVNLTMVNEFNESQQD